MVPSWIKNGDFIIYFVYLILFILAICIFICIIIIIVIEIKKCFQRKQEINISSNDININTNLI